MKDKIIFHNLNTQNIFQNISNNKREEKTNNNYIYYKVNRVIDGDTVNINMNGKIQTLRLLGINTPETVDPDRPVQCYGKEASDEAKNILNNQDVRIETDPTQAKYDKYGRELVYLWRQDGLFFNQYMINNGYAYEYTYKGERYEYQKEFQEVEQEAKNNHLGLWASSTCDGKLNFKK